MAVYKSDGQQSWVCR